MSAEATTMAEFNATAPATTVLEEENRQLRRAVEELSVLNDLARAIGASLDSSEIIATIVRRSLRAVDAEQGVVTLLSQDDTLLSMKTLVRTVASTGEHQSYHFSHSLLGWMQLNMRPLLVNDPQSDARFSGVKWDDSLRNLLCVPMMVRSELVAVLTVYNKRHGGTFDEEDQRLLAIIAAQSAQVVENARLFEREKELVHMKHEVELAARIQRNLLPQRPPAIDGYDIAGVSIAAQEVGGDYYDFIPLPEGLLGICLGDVSGKGLPASLLMSNVQAILRTHSSFSNSPAEALAGANRLLFDCTDTDKYVTLFYGALDPATGVLRYANAGHTRPLLFDRDGAGRRLEKRSVMLGMTGDFTFVEESVVIEEGEILVVVSDGITEAMGRMEGDTEEEEFGEEKLAEVVARTRSLGAGEIAATILEAVRRYATGMPQDDDMTVVVIKHQRQNA